jgi:hypothetical protein
VNEPIQVTIHIYMEMSQGNSLCSYLKHCFCKIREQESRSGPVWGEVGTSERGGEVGKGHGWADMVQILCTQV